MAFFFLILGISFVCGTLGLIPSAGFFSSPLEEGTVTELSEYSSVGSGLCLGRACGDLVFSLSFTVPGVLRCGAALGRATGFGGSGSVSLRGSYSLTL